MLAYYGFINLASRAKFRISSSSKTTKFGIHERITLLVPHNLKEFSTHTDNKDPSISKTKTDVKPDIESGKIKIRVAVVGAGVAGLSTALHLAPLAASGLISSPIHLYESSTRLQDVESTPPKSAGSGSNGRDIGVGIWSSALVPFNEKNLNRKSHVDFLSKIQEKGRWVNKVGYRTPKGHWLARSSLATFDVLHSSIPALLFLTEVDLISALRDAVQYEEEHCSTISTRYTQESGCLNGTVEGILAHSEKRTYGIDSSIGSGQLVFENGDISEDMYHVIIDASGMNSRLRSRYGNGNNLVTKHNNSKHTYQAAIDDRGYTVFRGTSPLSDDETKMKGVSFQTWGEGQSMRFATVPMKSGQAWFVTSSDPIFQRDLSNKEEKSPHDLQEENKNIILKAFQDWHDPIVSLIKSTPAETIIMEKAVAHHFSVHPVVSLHNKEMIPHLNPMHVPFEKATKTSPGDSLSTSEQRRLQRRGDIINGHGPILSFVGDANMTVDPVLAQGFTMAMEDASLLASSIEKSCVGVHESSHSRDKISSSSNSSITKESIHAKHNYSTNSPKLAFNPKYLRELLHEQHIDVYEPRLLSLLRATELVQSLAQPSTGTFMGTLSIKFIRPIMRLMPNFVKKPIFDGMAKYSLGMLRNKNNR